MIMLDQRRAAEARGQARETRRYLPLLILIAVVVMADPVSADTTVHLGGYSYHLSTEDLHDYNNWHRLVAVDVRGALLGRFANSFGRESTILAYGKTAQWGYWRGTIYLGAVHGYRGCYGDWADRTHWCPVAMPALRYARYRVQPGVLLLGDAVAVTVSVRM